MKNEKLLNEMLDVHKQIYTTKSWKRRKDLRKYLKRLEAKWWSFAEKRDEEKHA